MMNRSSGILMPIFSLPSGYGIGTIGKPARHFASFLAEAGQSYWQILPIGPTGYGNSPYQSLSSFAGNSYLIDLEELVERELLSQDEISILRDDGDFVDYGKLYRLHPMLLSRAARRGIERGEAAFQAFRAANDFWLREWSLFYALKKHFEYKPWYEWKDKGAKNGEIRALDEYREVLKDHILIEEYIQYLFYTQWIRLDSHCEKCGIKIIGDMPIYTALDSADVWANRSQFLLDSEGKTSKVAGVPPDYFNPDGQRWGNPIFNWEKMKKDKYSWWKKRIAHSAELYDVIRFDHFRGFESYWAIEGSSKTAKCGQWEKGPGFEFIAEIKKSFSKTDFIAEDLGFLTKEVEELLEKSGFPGMKVLQFAFDSREKSKYLPHAYNKNCVCYTGTHDNPTLEQWSKELSTDDFEFCRAYVDSDNICSAVLRMGLASTANLFIAQMQDWLSLGDSARINTPGTLNGNWQWRTSKDSLTHELAKRIRGLTELYGRK